MAEKRYGRQTPVLSVVLPYTQSLGTEAAEIYNRSKRSTLPWQELMLEDIMAVNEDGLWVHMKFGWSIPRRNGKSEILIIRAIWGVTHDRKVLYTAHRATTSSNAWSKCCDRLSEAGYVEGKDYKTTKKYGLETIEWLSSDAVINFRTRSSKGGLGEGYDDLLIDEAQEYTTDQESALKYVVTDSSNPQTLMCGTPPTAVSSGTVFAKYRKNTFSGKNENAGWAEWSVPALTDAHDLDLCYETNPSLGYILSERTVKDELGSDEDKVDDNIQRLGLWLTYSQRSAISRREWEELICKAPELRTPVRVYYAVKYAKSTGNVTLAAAVRTADGKIFVEAIDCQSARNGNDWITAYLIRPNAVQAAVDGAGNQDILVSEMKDAGVKCKAVLPKVSDIIEANALFEKKLFEGNICHAGQPSLTQAVSNCEHRPIGSSGGFGYTTILEGADATLIEAVSLAHWLCASDREKKKQTVSY